MKITHVNTWDNLGGAARAAFRLHVGLRLLDNESRMLVGWRVEPSRDVNAVMVGGPLGKRVVRRVASLLDRGSSLQYLCLPWGGDVLRHPFVWSADVIHLHNVHGGYFPYRMIPRLGLIAPVVWSLHDMWAVTGHCVYSYDCERWRTGCGRCPIPHDTPGLIVDTTALLWRVKRHVYRRSEPTIVAPSRWLADVVRQSPLLGWCDVNWIPNGLNTDVFRPRPKAVARECFGIPPTAQVVLFSADGLTERRKGAGQLQEALQHVTPRAGSDVVLLTMGSVTAVPELPGCRHPIHHLGMLRSEHLLAACYSAADVFVLSTLADNLPNTILESMACGTPVVSFNVGGVPELVRHMETGYLAQPGDARDLAKGVQLLLDDEDLRMRMGRRCREVAEREYAQDLQVRRFTALYREVLERRRGMSR